MARGVKAGIGVEVTRLLCYNNHMNTKTLLPEYAKNARGYLKMEEREALFRLAQNVPDGGVILNIGVEYGASIVCLRAGNDEAKLIGIDISYSRILDKAREGTELIVANSGERVSYWRDFIDLLFIDGDHGYRGVTLDTQYTKWLNPDGVVMFHDCYDWIDTDKPHHQVPGVMQAVDDWYKSVDKSAWIEHDKVGTSRLFQRIK